MVRPIVYVVDDDISIRRSLTRLLKSAGYDVETFASGPEFMRRVRDDHPACAVVDLRMPNMTGLELHEALVTAKDPVPVVFVTGYGDVPTGVHAMKAGAVDFLTKPYRADALLDAVRRAVERDRRDREVRSRMTEVSRRLRTLTPRERSVFALVIAGRLNKQVAAELGISEKTVKVHRARVMEKMQADSLASLVRMAQDLGEARTAS
jgi:RNA polymerase sigma factor (sigma-70 family)